MANKYYLCSKDIFDGPHLIGELRRTAGGDYEFNYMISGEKFPDWFMMIPGFENLHEVYSGEKVLRGIIGLCVPQETHPGIRDFLKTYEMTEYNPWEMLVAMIDRQKRMAINKQPLCDSHERIYFYEEMPERVHRYDQ